MKPMKLYRVTVRFEIGSLYKSNYVLANDSDEAYRKVRDDLVTRKIGVGAGRELERVELLAQDTPFPNCGARLYL